MIGRYFKIFLPTFVSLFTLTLAFFVLTTGVYADNDQWNDNENGYGSISVCKIILDEAGNVVDGSTRPGATFSISGIIPAQTTGEPADGQFGTANFATPLTLNESILGSGNDAQCQTFGGLEIGSHYYSTESIDPATAWATPKYNDQFTVNVNSLSDFFSYDANLFDGNGANDEARNKNADGHIVLTQGRPDRTLIVLNQMIIQPAVGGGPSIGGNITTPQCPSDRPQQVDQVWFTDIVPGSVTVHWANKGDAHSFHIAYGPAQNNLIWGVEVNNGNASQFTLQDLPGGDLWVSVIAKSSADCGGPSSPVVKAGVQPQALGATGIANSTILFSAGFGLIALGLWQTLKGLSKRAAKKA